MGQKTLRGNSFDSRQVGSFGKAPCGRAMDEFGAGCYVGCDGYSMIEA